MIGLVTPGPERYVVAVGVFTDQLDATLVRLRNLLIGIWFGALGLDGGDWLLAGLDARSIPIRRITHQAAAIADGKFAKRLDPPPQNDEIGQMTRLLNRMLDRLHGALEANRRFAADASHELRGPLTAVLGEIDVTLKRDRQPAEYRDALARLRERLQVMSRLTEDLMLLVRAQENRSPVVGEVRVVELLQRVVARSADARRCRRRLALRDGPARPRRLRRRRPARTRVRQPACATASSTTATAGSVSMTASVVPRERANGSPTRS